MAKKRTNRKQPEKERYEIEFSDWEVYYSFGIAPKSLRDIDSSAYWEISSSILLGKIISPALNNATKARVDISADPEKDDHWSEKPTVSSAKAIGFMEIPRAYDVLWIYCGVPPRLSANIHVAVASGKIKYVAIFGTKLKWRKGTVFDISLSTHRDEE